MTNGDYVPLADVSSFEEIAALRGYDKDQHSYPQRTGEIGSITTNSAITQDSPKHDVKKIVSENIYVLGACVDKKLGRLFFSDDETEKAFARVICSNCVVMKACEETARKNGERHGIWGGIDFSQFNPNSRVVRRQKELERKAATQSQQQ